MALLGAPRRGSASAFRVCLAVFVFYRGNWLIWGTARRKELESGKRQCTTTLTLKNSSSGSRQRNTQREGEAKHAARCPARNWLPAGVLVIGRFWGRGRAGDSGEEPGDSPVLLPTHVSGRLCVTEYPLPGLERSKLNLSFHRVSCHLVPGYTSRPLVGFSVPRRYCWVRVATVAPPADR